VNTRYDENALVGHIAQGDARYALETSRAYGGNGGSGGFPAFVRIVVLDVISDPSIIDEAKLSYWEHETKVGNIRYAAVAPRNAIIGRRILGNGASASEKTMVFFPFFPSHIAMPCKPGEHVWAMFENPDAKVNDIGYWFCRITDPGFVEDVNHTHSNRQFERSFQPGTIDMAEGTDDPVYEFPAGVTDEKDGQRYVIGSTATMVGDEKSYEKLLTDSDASKTVQYEAVPRYRKRPGDQVLEGTNNTLIVMGTDRTGPVAEYDSDPDKGKTPKLVNADALLDAGMIDIVVGRGQTPATSGKVVENVLGRKELGKARKEIAEHEGDPDLKNDRTRVMVSMKTKPDKNFKIDKVVKKHTKSIEDGQGTGAVVAKSDKIRIIARQDVVIMVTGATKTDANGKLIDDDEIDPDKCATITIKTNGEIVFTPAKNAVLKLGGESADKSVLCTKVNNKGAGGEVTSSAIVDSMGGSQGGADGLNGTFAKKVLLL
jgi:hypothetical protein